MKALILNDKVVQVEEQDFPVGGDLYWLDCPNDCKHGWLLENGELVAPSVNELSAEEKVQAELPSSDTQMRAVWKYIRDGDKTEFDSVETDIQAVYDKYSVTRD